jgi:hypothetical protein
MENGTVEFFGSIVVLGTTLSAVALIYGAFATLRKGWDYVWQNTIILTFLVTDTLFSLCVFNPPVF